MASVNVWLHLNGGKDMGSRDIQGTMVKFDIGPDHLPQLQAKLGARRSRVLNVL